MTDETNDDTNPSLELAGARGALPAYQRDELPRRLRGEWPGAGSDLPSAEGPATAAPDITRMSNTEARQYWRRHRVE